jgi:hypothetical protein
MGAVVLQPAKATSFVKRVGSRARSFAAEIGPTPGWSSRVPSRARTSSGELILAALGVPTERSRVLGEVAHDSERDLLVETHLGAGAQ